MSSNDIGKTYTKRSARNAGRWVESGAGGGGGGQTKTQIGKTATAFENLSPGVLLSRASLNTQPHRKERSKSGGIDPRRHETR